MHGLLKAMGNRDTDSPTESITSLQKHSDFYLILRGGGVETFTFK